MPIYDFKCSQCGTEQERMNSMSAPPPPCRECGGETYKMVSAPGMVHTNFANKTGFKSRKK